ncbi:MAG: hypothetical protein ACTSO4_17150 [Promethearchaeota archaeon]
MSQEKKTYKFRTIKSRLEQKGFMNSRSKKHHYMMFYYNGKKTRVHTTLNLRPNQTVMKGMFNKISKDLFLEKSELIDLIECPLSEEKLVQILKNRNAIRD